MKFPKYAIYNGDNLLSRFKKGDLLEFVHHCEKPSSKALGNAWYKVKGERNWGSELVNTNNIKPLNADDGICIINDCVFNDCDRCTVEFNMLCIRYNEQHSEVEWWKKNI